MNNKVNFKNSFQRSKWILLVCSATIFISCSNTETDERKNFGLKGNVKSCFERLYEAEKKFGKWENGEIEYFGHNRVTFDEKGQHLEIEYFDNDMDLIEKTLPVREKGKLLEKLHYNGDGKLRSKTIFLHISKNETDFESFDADGKKTDHGKNFRENGKLMKQICTIMRGSEDRTFTTLYEYDKEGNLISQKITNQKGEIVDYLKFEYIEFDAKKNWIKKLTYEDDDEPLYISIREIEYY